MSNSLVSQHSVQILHNGEGSNSQVSQVLVQALIESPTGIIFQELDCTQLYGEETLLKTNESNLSWMVLNSDDASAVTSVLDKGSNLNIVNGHGFIETDITPGTYIVIVQNGSGSIGAYVMDAN